MDFFLQDFFQNNWFVYGILLMVCIPIVIVLFNELSYALRNKSEELIVSLNTAKNFILPLIALSIVLSQVLEYSRTSTLMKLLETFIWILSINTLLSIFNTVLFKGLSTVKTKKKTPQLFLDIFRIVMVLIGAAIVLSNVWGADLKGLVTALGLGSFVIGLALQDTLGNLFSGIALVYEKPFQEGDFIEVNDKIGKVVEMNWRSVSIETKEMEVIIIPHLVIGQGIVKNLSRPSPMIKLMFDIAFSDQDPPNLIKKIILETIDSIPNILKEPLPEVKTKSYAEFKIIYEIEFLVHSYEMHEEVFDVLKTRIWYAAKRNNLTMMQSKMLLQNADLMPSRDKEALADLKNAIASLPMYIPIEKSNLDKLLDGSKLQFYGNGEKVIKQGDPTGQLYFILEGSASLETLNDKNYPLTITKLEVGDFFGEISLFTDKYSIFSVLVLEDLKLIVISPKEVLEMVEINPKLAQYLDDIMDARRIKKEKLMNEM